jgi:hypothetical protein
MRDVSGGDLLRLPVRMHGLHLGRPADLLLDGEGLRVVGLDVLCRDEVHRFLPLATASIGEEEIAIRSPLVLLEGDQLEFYRSRALALSALRGRRVLSRGSEAGVLRDMVLAPDGALRALVVEVGDRSERIPYDQTISLAPESRSAA